MVGGIAGGVSWEEYLEGLEDPWRRRFEELRHFVSSNGLYGLLGEDIQNEPMQSEILRILGDDFSFRAWGDFLAAICNDLAGEVEFDYMDFYYTYSPFYNEQECQRAYRPFEL